MICAIWYQLYNLKNMKNFHGGVLLLVKFQNESNSPPWVFFTFFKLYKWYQIAPRITFYWLCYTAANSQHICDTNKDFIGLKVLCSNMLIIYACYQSTHQRCKTTECHFPLFIPSENIRKSVTFILQCFI